MPAFSYIIKNEKEKFQTLDSYENGPETCESPSIDFKQFKTQVLEAIKDEIPLRFHTIGDRVAQE